MSDTMQSLDQLSAAEDGRAGSAEIRQEGRQAGPRLCHRQAQGRGRPRLDQARRRQDHRQHPRGRSLFRPSGAAHDDPAAAGRRRPRRPVRRDLHRRRRRSVGPGRRRASRHLQGADQFRAGSARRAEEGRLPDPRLRAWSSARSTAAPRRAVRSSSRSANRFVKFAANAACRNTERAPSGALFCCVFVDAVDAVFRENLSCACTTDCQDGPPSLRPGDGAPFQARRHAVASQTSGGPHVA